MARRKHKMSPVRHFPVGKLVRLTPVYADQEPRHVPWGSLGIVTTDPIEWEKTADELHPWPMAAVRFFIDPTELFVPVVMLTPIDIA